MLEIYKITVGVWYMNCYAVSNEDGQCILIDPGEDPTTIDEELVIANNLHPVAMIATHGHLDHIGAAKYFTEKYSAPLYIHKDDIPLAKKATYWANILGTPGITNPEKIKPLNMGKVTINNFNFKVAHTPGHTVGGVCIYLQEKGVVFTGDTLFYHAIGRSDRVGLDTGSQEILTESIKNKLFTLPSETVVLPGHECSTTIKHEQSQNPFLI